jgi:hypothetical protein
VLGRVAVAFAFEGEQAGDDLQARLVVVGEVDLVLALAGQALGSQAFRPHDIVVRTSGRRRRE